MFTPIEIKQAIDIIVFSGTINVVLNLFGALKRSYNLEKFDRPFDFGITWRGNRLLGSSTTWLGLVISLTSGLFIDIVYSPWGMVIGLGTFFGHALDSFVKRRLGKADGAYFPVFDHISFVFLTGLIFVLTKEINIKTFALCLIMALILHPIFCALGRFLRVRR